MKRMEAVNKKGQTEFGCDIFGVGTMIHRSDPNFMVQVKRKLGVLYSNNGSGSKTGIRHSQYWVNEVMWSV